MQLRCVKHEGSQRTRRRRHPRLGGTCAQEPRQPWQQPRQVAPTDRERPQRIRKPARNLPPDARRRHRNDGAGIEQRAVAIARCLFATRFAGLQDRHAMPVAQQLDCGGCADDAGADHDDMRHYACAAYAIELRDALGNVLQVRAERRRLIEQPKRRVGGIIEQLRLHLGAKLLLRREVGRVVPGEPQRLHLGIVRPAEPGRGRVGADHRQ